MKSAVGLGILLSEGIGDTLRISLAADPVEEIKVGFDLIKSLRIRSRGINFIACPSCSRQEFDVISTVNALEERLENVLTPWMFQLSVVLSTVPVRQKLGPWFNGSLTKVVFTWTGNDKKSGCRTMISLSN